MHGGRLIRGTVLALPVLMSACSSITRDQALRGDTLVGFTRVKAAVSSSEELQAYRISTLGAGSTAQGAFVGWRRSEMVIADPGKCQLLVIVRSNVQAANAASVLEKLKGENVCAADFSK